MAALRLPDLNPLEEIEHAAKEQGHSIETFLALAREHGFDQAVLVRLRAAEREKVTMESGPWPQRNVIAMVPTDDAMSGLPATFVSYLFSKEGQGDNFVFMRSLILDWESKHWPGAPLYTELRSNNVLAHQHWVARGPTENAMNFYDWVKQGKLTDSGTAIGPSPFSKVHQEFKGSFVGNDYLVRVDLGDRKKRWLPFTADTAGQVVYTSKNVSIHFTSGLFLTEALIRTMRLVQHGRLGLYGIIHPDAPVDLATRVVSKDYNWDDLGYTVRQVAIKPGMVGAPVVYYCMNVSCGAEAEYMCDRCKNTTYCSEECQRVCWSEHSKCCGHD